MNETIVISEPPTPDGAIMRRFPYMRRDELERLAIMLDNERALNNELSTFRSAAAARKSAMGWEIQRLKEELGKLGSRLTSERTRFYHAMKKERTQAKRRETMARRRALVDVCDVLNYARDKNLYDNNKRKRKR